MSSSSPPPPRSVHSLERAGARVELFRDSCNVYAIRSRDDAAALLVDCGRGLVLGPLRDEGVAVEWALHTHHHRDQCSADAALVAAGTRLAVPAYERRLWESAEASWDLEPVFDVYDASGARNRPVCDTPVSRALADGECFTWDDLRFEVLAAPGHTRGAVVYLVEIDGARWAFGGDVIHSSGRVWTLHDLQWHYTHPDALDAAIQTVQRLRRRPLDRIAPSHGDVIDEPAAALEALEANLRRLHAVSGGGFRNEVLPPPSFDERIEQVSEHLYAVTHSCANFYVLRSRSGKIAVFDYGFAGMDMSAATRFTEHSFDRLRDDYGIDRVDVVIPTHYHDDHVSGITTLQRRYGAEVWAFGELADVLADPASFRLLCLHHEPIDVARVYGEGELRWEEYSFQVRHAPGHTWHAVMLAGEVDGTRVAISGDEFQLDRHGRIRGGGPVYRNRLRLGSFARSSLALDELRPALLLTGHDGLIPMTPERLREAREWSQALDRCFEALAGFPFGAGFAVDPYWIETVPYQQSGTAGEELRIEIRITNHDTVAEHTATAGVEIPAGWAGEPYVGTVVLGPGERGTVQLRLRPPVDAAPGRHVLPVIADLDGIAADGLAEAIVTLT